MRYGASVMLRSKSRVLPALLALAGAVVLSACSSQRPGPEPLASEEARALFQDAVELTLAEDWERLCLLPGDSTGPRNSCLDEVNNPSLYPRPTGEPEIVGERRASESEIVLVTCVQTEAGPIRSEFYVLNYDGNVIAPNPVYWIPRTVSDPNGDGSGISPEPTGQPPGAECE